MYYRNCTVIAVLLAAVVSTRPGGGQDRAPVLIDTDFAADIDDAFALGLAFGSYELDVRGITIVGKDTHKKAMAACRFLTVTGRRHTRVAKGEDPQPEREITDLYKYYYHPDPLFDRTTKPEKQSAVDFLHARLKQQPGKVTLLAIGPLTNVARLLKEKQDARELIGRIILTESNIKLDIPAAQHVIGAGVPLVVVSADAVKDLKLNEEQVEKVFSPGTALTRQVEAMYQMWDRPEPPLGETLAAAICFEETFATLAERSLVVDDQGALQSGQGKPNALVVSSVDSDEFVNWYVDRMASLLPPKRRPSKLVEQGMMPHRVHVAEDFDNDIERFWWMSGKPETRLLPEGSRRACRGVLTHDFDDLLMVSREMYAAVVFNPVPGPPMGKNARLSFRYWLKGTDTIRVQIYSLTNGYHRHLVVAGLPQETWQHATVDMTQARRPDGTGGPLGENERIDDIQFYIDPNAEIIIDDVVLYDAAAADEKRPFPKRIMFTGIFDTGNQQKHWLGDFEIVPDAGNFWRAAHSVKNDKTGQPWVRLHLRGQRRLGAETHVAFRYRLKGAGAMRVRIVNSETKQSQEVALKELTKDEWAGATAEFSSGKLPTIDEVHFLLPTGADLLLDDVLLYEP